MSSPIHIGSTSVALARRVFCSSLTALLLAAACVNARADDPPKTEEQLQRDAAIAEFSAKMKAANYPALFEKAAVEFNVPVNILQGVAFAETRWEHLTWPAGETASPETGMPRPYGIMSLWDNEYFGHSLTDAAKLIGKDPEDLKKDPLTNIRGAAALLKKLYGENPKPDGTTEADLESWRYAIVKYCGIPEPDLSQQHGLDVFEFINDGFHQYGIEMKEHPVNLGPMREEVKRIVAIERKKLEERIQNDPALRDQTEFAVNRSAAPTAAKEQLPLADAAAAVAVVPAPSMERHWLLWSLLAVVGLLGLALAWRRQKPRSAKSR